MFFELPPPPALIANNGMINAAATAGCEMTSRQAEVIHLTLQMNNINFALYFGSNNTNQGFAEVLRRAVARYGEVAIIYCNYGWIFGNVFHPNQYFSVPGLNYYKIATIQADDDAPDYDIWVARR